MVNYYNEPCLDLPSILAREPFPLGTLFCFTMEIRALSGAIVAQLYEEELGGMVLFGQSVRDLKNLLSVRCLGGTSRFRQRLLAEEMGELQDDMPVGQLPPSLQLVVLDYCAPQEAVWQALLSACGTSRVVEVASLLQKPLDPNWTGADTDRPPGCC